MNTGIALCYLQYALQAAAEYRGSCAPNPAVGAVVVDQRGVIIGVGAHLGCGKAHAEVVALADAGNRAQGAYLYVTLEPCCHYGRTPPCTQAIIKAGIATVVYGYTDPNPSVSGRAAAILQASNILCTHLPCRVIDTFYRSYTHWSRTAFPWVTAKLALSADAKIAGAGGRPRSITGQKTNRLTHQLRRRADAILTTTHTIMHDNPQLNARVSALDGNTASTVEGKSVYLLDGLRCPLRALALNQQPLQLLQTAKQVTLFYNADAVGSDYIQQLVRLGVKTVAVPVDDTCPQYLSWPAVLGVIGQHGHHDLWVEAGGRCFFSLLAHCLVQRALFYFSPVQLGGSATPAALRDPIINTDKYQLNWYSCEHDIIVDCRKFPYG